MRGMMLLPDFDLPKKPYASGLTKLQEFWFQPSFHGLEHIRQRPAMYVGNHTLYGVLDVPLLRAKLYNDHDIFLRMMVNRIYFDAPYLKSKIEAEGGFVGTRELCQQAMEQGDSLLLYPGGGREVTKRDGEAYQLIWKERLGFVKMAATHGYPIQPFASIGADDAYSILMDARDFQRMPWLRPIKNTRIWTKMLNHGDEIPPLARGVGLSPIPRPEPFFFIFGESINTTAYQNKTEDDEAMFELRDQVETAVQDLINRGKTIRNEAPRPNYWRRLLNRL